MALADIYQKATLVQIPSGYKSGTLFSVVPNTAVGDFTVTGDAEGEATRVNKDGLIETVAANVPRLDYNPTNPQDPTLLLEPQRTNDTTHSEDFTQTSYWNNVIDVVATTNQTTAPDGSNTGNKIQANSGTNFKILRKGAFTIPSGITMSIFVKRGNHDYITFKAQGDFNFNLSTLTWGGSYSNVGYELYPNDWVRLHHTTTSSSTSYFGIYLTDSSFNQSWNATGDEFVYVWGAQYETGTYPTSYIPTSGGAGTRTVDTCGDAGNGTIIKAEGSLFVDFTTSNSANNKRISITDASDSNNNIFIQLAGTSFAVQIVSGGTILYSWAFAVTLSDRHKLALRYKDGDSKLYYNGVEKTATTASGTWFTDGLLDTFSLNQGSGLEFYGELRQAMLFEALTDAELTTLTT